MDKPRKSNVVQLAGRQHGKVAKRKAELKDGPNEGELFFRRTRSGMVTIGIRNRKDGDEVVSIDMLASLARQAGYELIKSAMLAETMAAGELDIDGAKGPDGKPLIIL